MPATKPLKDMSIQDLIDQIEATGTEARDRFGELVDDIGLRTRFCDATEAMNDLRLALLRQLRGEPATTPLEEMTVEELHHLAGERDIPGRSSMNKAELIDALRTS
ncbi:MAG TPA: Rho termination factor N-terminal domain-containing protein [Acidimicrobiales bacterium]|nr:Rho termination factor N-terminal domain-containing protein [Acidimicrobiales bacterium]